MTHEPDLEQIPASLRSLNWKRMDIQREWEDGQILLAAVPVRHDPQRESWRYEFDVVLVNCDIHYFQLTVGGETWGWDLDDVDYYVEIRR
jgi:hypothetical protein